MAIVSHKRLGPAGSLQVLTSLVLAGFGLLSGCDSPQGSLVDTGWNPALTGWELVW